MPNNAGFVPTFSGKTSLSLSDLDALSAAVNSLHGTEYVPAGGHRGQRRYRLANFNLGQVNEQGHDVFSNEGMVRAVGFSVEDEPYIREGEVVLPVAHYVPGSAEDEPAATGALASVVVEGGITAPDIQRGQMRLPLADSTECGGAVAGLIQAVQLDDDATSPYIEQGVLHLTEAGGCSCVPAEYDPLECVSTLGLVRSIQVDASATVGKITDGNIFLPLAGQTSSSWVNGVVGYVSQFSGVPEPGVDGWVQTLYLPMQSANGGAQIVSYRQLMRFFQGALQVSAQRCLHPEGNWEEYFNV